MRSNYRRSVPAREAEHDGLSYPPLARGCWWWERRVMGAGSVRRSERHRAQFARWLAACKPLGVQTHHSPRPTVNGT
jgi:hypothetical protein